MHNHLLGVLRGPLTTKHTSFSRSMEEKFLETNNCISGIGVGDDLLGCHRMPTPPKPGLFNAWMRGRFFLSRACSRCLAATITLLPCSIYYSGGCRVILGKTTYDNLNKTSHDNLDKITHDNPMLASAPLLPSILPRMELVAPLVYTTLIKLSIPLNRWSACIYAFAPLGDAVPVPESLFLLTSRRPPRIMIRSSMPRITASVTIAPITPAQ
jgi:hypothetical protein